MTDGVVITCVLLCRYLENVAKGKTSEAITKLLSLQAPTAILLTTAAATTSGGGGGEGDYEVAGERELDASLVQRGDLLKVLPGAHIPVDGRITFGRTTIDESMITGTFIPNLLQYPPIKRVRC